MTKPIYEFTEDSSEPFYIKALIEPFKTWTGYFGKPVTITYAYPDNNQLEDYKSVQKDSRTIITMDQESRNNMEKAFRIWESYANVKFIENNKNYQLPIYKFNEEEFLTEGYAYYPHYDLATGSIRSNGIGINTKMFERLSSLSGIDDERSLETHIHEVGHALTLKHGFDEPFALETGSNRLITHSIMNYKTEKYAPEFLQQVNYRFFPGVMKIRAVTPMPWDIEAAQFIYGVNPTVGLGDDLYELNKLVPHQSIFSWLTVKPAFSLPWDNGGIDTISAKGIHSDVVIDINPFGRSQVKNSFMMMPNMNIENVIAGNGANKIVLNALDNIVDLSDAKKSSTIITNPMDCGHDTVIHFNPEKDKLVLLSEDQSAPHWELKTAPSGEVIIDNKKIAFEGGTQIEFNKNNTITLIGVSPNELNVKNTIEIKTHTDVEKLLWDYFSLLPKKLFNDFSSAFLQGAGMTFILGLSKDALKHYGCTDEQIATFNHLYQAVLMVASGQFLPALAGFLTNTVLDSIGTSNEISERWAFLISTLLTSLLAAETPDEAAETFVKLTGAYCGSRFMLWSKNKVVDLLHSEPVQTKIQQMNDKLNLQYHSFSIWAKEKAHQCLPEYLDPFERPKPPIAI